MRALSSKIQKSLFFKYFFNIFKKALKELIHYRSFGKFNGIILKIVPKSN